VYIQSKENTGEGGGDDEPPTKAMRRNTWRRQAALHAPRVTSRKERNKYEKVRMINIVVPGAGKTGCTFTCIR
jgi:hypothetical protein